MKTNEINIRDPFVLFENGKYYMYGTRGENFGQKTGGFDVYVSTDLENWSEPIECFNSDKYNMNTNVNWAPEVHKYKDSYYMFATFTKPNGLRGTYILKADNPMGEFKPHSKGAVTPEEWECLDGTICYAELNDDLTATVGEVVTMFAGSEPFYIKKAPDDGHFVTDGPFMFRSETNELFMLWSTFINHQYAECLVKFNDCELNMNFTHLDPLIDDDGGHGMIFKDDNNLYLTFHSPNKSLSERPKFVKFFDNGENLTIN